MERLINGKPFATVRKELEAPFTHLVNDGTGKYLSVSIEQVEERLNSVLGFNYSFVPVGELKLNNINGRYSLTGLGIITIRDDNGGIVCTMCQGGGCDVILIDKVKGEINDEKVSKDLSSDYKSAMSDIKKKCAEGLGVGAYVKMQAKIRNNKFVAVDERGERVNSATLGTSVSSGTNSNSSRVNNSNNTEPDSIVVQVQGKPVCRGKAIRIPGQLPGGKVCEILVWESLFAENPDIRQKLLQVKQGNRLSAKATIGEEQGKTQVKVSDINSITIE